MDVRAVVHHRFLLELRVPEEYFVGRATDLSGDRLVIGSGEECDLIMHETSVLEEHGVFEVRGEVLIYHAGEPTYGTIFLEPGDEIGMQHREIAHLPAVDGSLQWTFPPEGYGRWLIMQVGQVMVDLRVTSLHAPV